MVGTMNLWAFVALPISIRQSVALNIAGTGNVPISRRNFALHIPAATSAAAILAGSTSIPAADAATSSSASVIANRFDSDILTSPPITAGSRFSGHENLYFPSWMEGEWDATQTLVSTKAPLGLKYVGGPNGSLDIAEKSMDEQTKRLNEAVNLKLKFVKTNFGVAEDRTFNLKSRLNSFAGKNVVSSVGYADVRESNRASVLASGGTEEDPLTTTLVYFKGPAAQKTFVVSHGQDPLDSETWTGYELDRSIFALTNQSTAPPLTTDTELLYSFKRVGNDQIEGRLRLAGYLQPQGDMLYFDARNRAVSLADYTLTLKRSTGAES